MIIDAGVNPTQANKINKIVILSPNIFCNFMFTVQF